jgi:hypothetical protein
MYGLYNISSLSTTQNTKSISVPLVRRNISLNMSPIGVHITEELLFVNNSTEDIETEFKYPSKGCRIYGLRFKIEDEPWNVMTVEEKTDAEKKYKQAVSSGHQAALGSQLSDSVFSIKIGRLSSHEMVKIETNLFSELDWADCYAYTHKITSFSPYENSKTVLETVSKKPVMTTDKLPYGVYVNVQCSDNSPFKVDMVCDEVMTDMKSNDKNVFEKNRLQIKGDSDINIRMYPTKMEPVLGLTQTDDTYYFQVSAGHTPNSMGILKPIKVNDADTQLQEILKSYDTLDSESTPDVLNLKNYVFVVDGSGSMKGQCITNATKALKIAIKQLPDGSKYMIYMFGDNGQWRANTINKFYPAQKPIKKTSVKKVHPGISCDDCHSYPIEGDRHTKDGYNFDLCDPCYQSQDNSDKTDFNTIQGKDIIDDTHETVWVTHSDETFKDTVVWIDENVNANYGCTKMAIAVNAVIERLSVHDSNVIVMLTDAGVDSTEIRTIVKSLETSAVKPEVFCMGLGGGVTMPLLESMSNYGRGISIEVNDFSTIKKKCITLMNYAVNSKFLRNITCEVPLHMEVNTCKPIKSYFMGEPLNIFVKVSRKDFTGKEKLIVKSSGTPFMELGFDHTSDSSVNLEMVFHMTLLESMEKNPTLYYSYNNDDDNNDMMTKEEYNKYMVEIGCKYNIVTSRTSAVFVRELENADGTKQMEKIDIPISINKDKITNSIQSHTAAYFCSSVRSMRAEDTSYNPNNERERGCSGRLFGNSSGERERGVTTTTLGWNDVQYDMYVLENDSDEDSDDMDGCAMMDCYVPPKVKAPKKKNTSLLSAKNEVQNFTSTNYITNALSSLTSISPNEKTDVSNKYNTMNTEQLIDEMILSQKSDGTWSNDVLILNHITIVSDDEYKKHIKMTDFNKDDYMTLMIMAFFQSKTEFYTTYVSSLRKATNYMDSKVDDLKSVLLNLTKVGFK